MSVERLLQMVVGLADTFVINYTGEASVSGVFLVNQFNTIFIFLSTSLAAIVLSLKEPLQHFLIQSPHVHSVIPDISSLHQNPVQTSLQRHRWF